MINWVLYTGVVLTVLATMGYIVNVVTAVVLREDKSNLVSLILYAIGIYLIMLGVK